MWWFIVNLLSLSEMKGVHTCDRIVTVMMKSSWGSILLYSKEPHLFQLYTILSKALHLPSLKPGFAGVERDSPTDQTQTNWSQNIITCKSASNSCFRCASSAASTRRCKEKQNGCEESEIWSGFYLTIWKDKELQWSQMTDHYHGMFIVTWCLFCHQI